MEKEGYTIFRGPLKSDPKGLKALKIADRQGDVQFIKKSEQGNKNSHLDGRYIAKIMNDENDYKPKQISFELKVAIAQARQDKLLSQEKFAQLLNIQKGDLNSWEAGKSVPSGQMIAKMDKLLGVKLPRPAK